jgi:TatD DNase family protein
MLIDTHAHLNDKSFDPDRGEAISLSFAAGVGKIVEIACASGEWKQGEELCAAYPGKISCAFGAHPEYAKTLSPELLADLAAYMAKPCAVALGEVGIDYWWDIGTREEQAALLDLQLPLCARFGKPAVFHARNGRTPEQNAYADLLGALRRWEYKPARRFRGVLHCFSGTWADARAGLDLGLCLGVNGTFTYKKNGDLRETAKKAGIENIVLETDCPYLPPEGSRGQRNNPAFIPEIAAMVASYLGLSNSGVAAKTTANAFDLFGEF